MNVDLIGCFESSIGKGLSEECILINIDGVVQLQSGNAADGGIVQDETRDWVFGYNRYSGQCSIFYAKLWGILEVLNFIRRRAHEKVIIQSDSLEVVKALQGSVSSISYSALTRRIQCILSQEGLWILRYIPKEHN
ncbi:hypothetical protein Goari_004533 [Gossypium aridum]|uniref:RNase H type-1 domain-containing protein n=1 Tax=Gossypium aridum TaxID=34290 RepID=A0A7J8Y3T4_GOSAI|nr:hypothetical protein [Gossypium aridum]